MCSLHVVPNAFAITLDAILINTSCLEVFPPMLSAGVSVVHGKVGCMRRWGFFDEAICRTWIEASGLTSREVNASPASAPLDPQTSIQSLESTCTCQVIDTFS